MSSLQKKRIGVGLRTPAIAHGRAGRTRLASAGRIRYRRPPQAPGGCTSPGCRISPFPGFEVGNARARSRPHPASQQFSARKISFGDGFNGCFIRKPAVPAALNLLLRLRLRLQPREERTVAGATESGAARRPSPQQSAATSVALGMP